jgi:hypothetical protein
VENAYISSRRRRGHGRRRDAGRSSSCRRSRSPCWAAYVRLGRSNPAPALGTATAEA